MRRERLGETERIEVTSGERPVKRVAVSVCAVLAALALVAAGCGGDDGGNGDAAGTATAEGGTGGDSDLLAKAKADAEAASAGVESFEDWSPGPAPAPQEGAHVGTVTCPFFIPACKRISDALAEAGEAMGWEVTSLDGGVDTPSQRAAVRSLVNENVDGMVLMGFGLDPVADVLEEAEQAGIAMVSEATPHASSLPIAGDVNVQGGFPAAGEQLGAWVANDSGGEATILWFSADVNPGLVERHEGFHEYLSQFSGIKFEPQEPIVVPEGDVGAPLQQRAVSVLQAHPEGTIDYVYACCDAWTTSIVEAAQSLGRDELKMVSFDGAPQNLEFIRQGRNQVADQATPWGWCGWLTMDQLNRVMAGEEFVDVGCPSKVLDQTNLPPEGEEWDGDIDYKAEFRELWGVE